MRVLARFGTHHFEVTLHDPATGDDVDFSRANGVTFDLAPAAART